MLLPRLRGLEDRLRPLLVGERAHHREALGLLVLEDGGARVLARRGHARLRPPEGRRHHHLIAQHEVVHVQMVSVELPAPGLGGRRLAHDRDPVLPVAVLDEVVAVELTEGFVEVHDVARQLQPLGAQRRAEHGERGLALRRRHLLERDAFTKVGMLVGPFAPLHVIDGKDRLGALRGRQRFQERPRPPDAPAPWTLPSSEWRRGRARRSRWS